LKANRRDLEQKFPKDVVEWILQQRVLLMVSTYDGSFLVSVLFKPASIFLNMAFSNYGETEWS